jgi:type I restriction enzyme S subunit
MFCKLNLNYEDFSLIRLVYPPKDIVEKFNNLYEPIMTFKKHLNKKIIKLEKIRNILLPKLMSGEIDVSKVEI